MGQDEIFEVEVWHAHSRGAADPPGRLPRFAMPLPDEALTCWAHRFAEPLGLRPELLLFERSDRQLISRCAWWHRPPTTLIDRLAQRAGLSTTAIRAMTFSGWAPDARTDEIAGRFARTRSYRLPSVASPVHRYGVCPRCLAEDPIPYIRKTWTLGWISVCEAHHVVLVTRCPGCRGKFRIPTLWAGTAFRADRCYCGEFLPGIAEQPAHELAVEFQLAMLTGRERNEVTLRGLGVLAWPVAIALFDVLLEMVWLEPVPRTKHPVLVRIKEELGLAREHGTENYDGLLLLAWLLASWPQHMCAAAESLEISCSRWTSKRWQVLDPDTKRAVQALLEPAGLHTTLRSEARVNVMPPTRPAAQSISG